MRSIDESYMLRQSGYAAGITGTTSRAYAEANEVAEVV